MNRTGDQTCFLFSRRDRDSVSNSGQAYSEAIQDKEKILSILRINPSKKYSGRSRRRMGTLRAPVALMTGFCTDNEGNLKPSGSFATCRRDLYVELSARCYDYGRGGKVE
jgi:hypothetical protein